MIAPTRPTTTWPPFLTTRRVRAYTGRGRTTINRAVASGALPVYGRPGGGERVFRREDVDRWLASGLGEARALPPDTASVRRAGDGAKADPIEAIARIRRTAARGAP